MSGQGMASQYFQNNLPCAVFQGRNTKRVSVFNTPSNQASI